MTMVDAKQCRRCKNFDNYRCPAFPGPGGIPEVIMLGGFDHREAFPGDHGIRFEPIEEE